MTAALPAGIGVDHSSLSELLAQIVADESRERVSVDDLLGMAGDRAFGALMFIFALPNIVPTPPGTSAMLGLPLVILSFQFSYGRSKPWLPKVISRRSIARTDLAAVVSRTLQAVRRIERVAKPRLGFLVTAIAERLIGLMMLVLSVILFLPIPLGNMLPAAAICVLSLALLEHDGLAALLGAVMGLVAVVLVWGALLALLRAAIVAIEHLGG